MKTAIITVMTAFVLNQFAFSQPVIQSGTVDSYSFSGIEWGTKIPEVVRILRSKGYVDKPKPWGPILFSNESIGDYGYKDGPDYPKHELTVSFLKKYPATVLLYSNEKNQLWKIRIKFRTKPDVREDIFMLLKNKYGTPDPFRVSPVTGFTKAPESALRKAGITPKEFSAIWYSSSDGSELEYIEDYIKPNMVTIEYSNPQLVDRSVGSSDF